MIKKENMKYLNDLDPIAIYSAIVATYLLILELLKFRKNSKTILHVSATINDDLSNIDIVITNKGLPIFTVKSIQILYGNDWSSQLVFESLNLELPTFSTTESRQFSISREKIISNVQTLGIRQSYHCELFCRVNLTTDEYQTVDLSIPDVVLDKDYHGPAIKFIKTDLYIGFKPLPIESSEGLKMKVLNK